MPIREYHCTECGHDFEVLEGPSSQTTECEVCGAEIDHDRLEILPETTMCVHCRERIEKSSHAAELMDRAGLFDFDSSDVALESGPGDDAGSSIDLGNDDV